MVTMQHASFLYRQRTFRGLRSAIETTTSTSSSRCEVSSFKNLWNATNAHTLLLSRSKKSCKRSIRTDMSSFFKARNAGRRSIRPGGVDRWGVFISGSRVEIVKVWPEKLAILPYAWTRCERQTSTRIPLSRAILYRKSSHASRWDHTSPLLPST